MAGQKSHTEEDFAEIDRQIKAASAEVQRLEAVRVAMVAEHWGCQPGSEVVYKGERHLVKSVNSFFGGIRSKPWLKGCKRRKDGSWSEAERTIYSEWEIAPVEADAEAP